MNATTMTASTINIETAEPRNFRVLVCSGDTWAQEQQFIADQDAAGFEAWRPILTEWANDRNVQNEGNEDYEEVDADDLMDEFKDACTEIDVRNQGEVVQNCGYTEFTMQWAWMLGQSGYMDYVKMIARHLLAADDEGDISIDAECRAKIEGLAA